MHNKYAEALCAVGVLSLAAVTPAEAASGSGFSSASVAGLLVGAVVLTFVLKKLMH